MLLLRHCLLAISITSSALVARSYPSCGLIQRLRIDLLGPNQLGANQYRVHITVPAWQSCGGPFPGWSYYVSATPADQSSPNCGVPFGFRGGYSNVGWCTASGGGTYVSDPLTITDTSFQIFCGTRPLTFMVTPIITAPAGARYCTSPRLGPFRAYPVNSRFSPYGSTTQDVQRLTLDGTIRSSGSAGVTVHGGLGATPGVLLAGVTPASTPFFGGTLLVAPSPSVAFPILTDQRGEASIVLPVAGVSIPLYLQGALLDTMAPFGLLLSHGLAISP
ncbi:MAG: hypothetical protein IPM29_05180 [Planctomycetes bacterium]|nr:hypothetical protein [Planctomycetota bacterium]